MSAPAPGNAVYLVAGSPAASPSAVTRELAERLPASIHVRADLHHRMLVSRTPSDSPDVPRAPDDATDSADTGPGRSPGRKAQQHQPPQRLRMCHQLTAQVVDGYFSAGFDVVTQGAALGSELTALVTAIRSRPLHVVMLAPCPSATGTNGSAGQRLHQPQASGDPLGTSLWISTAGTPAETVDEILTKLPTT